YGLTPANFQTQVQLSLEGVQAGNILEKEQLSPVRIIYPYSSTQSVNGLKQMQIFLPSGKLKSINDLASIRFNAGDAEIERENLQSMGVVTGRLENRDLGSVMKDIQQKVSTKIAMPKGYHIEYGGAFAEQQQSFKEL